MTLTERLEAKRAEHDRVQAQESQLWKICEEKEAAYKAALNPWNEAYDKRNKIAKEIEVLEAMVKEIAQ